MAWMRNETPFLDAIRAAPDDDGPRLIYADWLEEHGDPRGHFVRLQCHLATLPEDDPARDDLEDEERGLLAEHAQEWTARLRELGASWEFRRGLIERLTIPAAAFLRHADDLFLAYPLRRLRLGLNSDHVPALAKCEPLNRLEGLDLHGGGLRDVWVEHLLEAHSWPRLHTLLLAHNAVEGPLVRTLAASPLMAQLRALDFSHNPAFGTAALRLLLTANAASLADLRLADTNLTASVVRDLFLSTALPRLRTLDVTTGWRRELARSTRDLRPVGAVFAASPLLAGLERLALSGNHLGQGGANALASSLAAQGLRELYLSAAWLSLGEVRELADSPRLAGLKTLDLGDNSLPTDAALRLAESEYLRDLRTLYLGGNNFRDTGVKAVLAAGWPLRALDLNHTGIGGPGIRALAGCDRMGALRHLDLSGNFVNSDSVAALAGSPHLTGLRRLELNDCRLTADCLRALGEAKALPRLTHLALGSNRLGDVGAKALARWPGLARLNSLDVSQCDIGPAGTEALATSPHCRPDTTIAIEPPQQLLLRRSHLSPV